VTSGSGMAIVSSGTSPTGSGDVSLRRNLKYRPGMGSLVRLTALFDTPVVNNTQLAGIGNGECGYYFGYSGTNFGIFHQETSQREIRKLTITPSGIAADQTVTITLNGATQTISIPSAASTNANAISYLVATSASYAGVGVGWYTGVIDGTVFFVSARPVNYTGSYSITSTNTITGSFTTIKSGATGSTIFITQSSWNIDRVDGGVSAGPNPSGMILNPQKGNVYQVGFQYLGFGNAFFAIEDPELGRAIPVHIIKNANVRTTPVLKNPQMTAKLVSANVGSTTSVSPKCASMAIFTEGMSKLLDPRFSKGNTFTNYNSTIPAPVLALRGRRVFNNETCYVEFDILRITASNLATQQTLTVYVYKDVQIISNNINFQYVDENNSATAFATLTAGTDTINVTGKTPLLTFNVGANSAEVVNIPQEELVTNVGETLVFAISTSGPVSGEINVNWFEQQ
jgi:hypothetical protein